MRRLRKQTADAPHRGGEDRGVALIEFALILPLLLMLVFGIIEFGRAYNARLVVTHAAREGVRVLAVTEDQTAAEAATLAAVAGLDPNDVTITATPCVSGQPAKVDVSYDIIVDIPGAGSHDFTVTGTAVMTCLE